jgi:hypothetical protein
MDDYVSQDAAAAAVDDADQQDVGHRTMAGVFRIPDEMWQRNRAVDPGACQHASLRRRAAPGA